MVGASPAIKVANGTLRFRFNNNNIMKTSLLTRLGLLLAAMTAFCVLGSSQAKAEDWGGHYRYNDRDGFYDGHRHYHHFEYYRSHRGYWDERNGVRIFINLG